MFSLSKAIFNPVSVALPLAVLILITQISPHGCLCPENGCVCPEKGYLLPCTCIELSIYLLVDIDCTDARSEEEIDNVFNNPLNVTIFYSYEMHVGSKLRRLENNNFGNSTFEKIVIQNTDLEYFELGAFANSYDTMALIDLTDNNLREDFPFETIENFSQLLRFYLSYNEIAGPMPVISSSSLVVLNLDNNYLSSLSEGILDNLPELGALALENNLIESIGPGIFDSFENLVTVDLARNLLTSIPSNTFIDLPFLQNVNFSSNAIEYVEEGAFNGTEALRYIRLDHNEISDMDTIVKQLPMVTNFFLNDNKITSFESDMFAERINCTSCNLDLSNNQLEIIEEGAFSGIKGFRINLDLNQINYIEEGAFPDYEGWVYLSLRFNQLTTLDEYWLRPLLETEVRVQVNGNPLECGCDIAWILDFPDDLSFFYEYNPYCGNGTFLADLDVQYFLDNC